MSHPAATALIGALLFLSMPSNATEPTPPATVVVVPLDPSTVSVGVTQTGDALGRTAPGAASSGPGSVWLGPVPVCVCPWPGPVPATPGVPAGPPPPPPPAVVGATAARQVPLPSPTLRVRPGEAMVGRLAYLEIGGPQTLVWSGVVLGQAVTISATSTYDVTWGDGSPTETGITNQGGPWPGGDITHAYQYAGKHTITVVQRWTATWTAEGTTGTIAGALFTTGTLVLPAHDVQATRD